MFAHMSAPGVLLLLKWVVLMGLLLIAVRISCFHIINHSKNAF